MIKLVRVIIVASVLLSLVCLSCGRQVTSGLNMRNPEQAKASETVVVTITNGDGSVAPGVRVYSPEYLGETDQDGRLVTFFKEPGEYELTARKGKAGDPEFAETKALINIMPGPIELLAFDGIDPAQVATLNSDWDDSLPLIDQVGKSTKEAISLLNGVGLAEAHLYLKRPCQISDGQRYRFAVARLCDSKKPLWVADDFASTLDALTAAIVAKGLRKISWKVGSTIVLAAPHVEHFVDSLLPNKLVHLRWGGFALVYSLHLVCEIVDSAGRAKVSNTCRHELSNVTIGGMSDTGEIKKLEVIPTLKPNAYELVEIAASAIQQFAALVVNTDQKVGDVIYIGSASH